MLYSLLLAALFDFGCAFGTMRLPEVPAFVPAFLQAAAESSESETILRWVDVDSRAMERVAGLS